MSHCLYCGVHGGGHTENCHRWIAGLGARVRELETELATERINVQRLIEHEAALKQAIQRFLDCEDVTDACCTGENDCPLEALHEAMCHAKAVLAALDDGPT